MGNDDLGGTGLAYTEEAVPPWHAGEGPIYACATENRYKSIQSNHAPAMDTFMSFEKSASPVQAGR